MQPTSLRVAFLVLMCLCVALATAQSSSSGQKSKRKNQRRQQPPEPSKVQKASARIIGPNGVAGIITFECLPNGSEVKITGEVTGLNPGFHGFHIHQFGDHSDPSCKAMGPHFNPANKNHGAPSDATRHAGDLGNIKANAQGVATIDQVDGHIALNGPNSIIGRGVVVHANRDDLGKGGVAESLKTGNAGGRIACGSIAIAKTV